MFTIALVGPDGSGKSLVSRRLVDVLRDLPIKKLYMGINLEASNVLLPTTWLLLMLKRAQGGRPDMAGPFDPSQKKATSKKGIKRLLSGIKTWALLTNRIAEEWFRQLVAWIYQKQGYNVLFDRHFVVDYYFYDIAYDDPHKPLSRRFHGYLLKHYYPRPDLVVYLDAPANLLFERKHEGTIESIERRRQEYLSLRDVMPSFAVVDGSQPVDQVVDQAAGIIRNFARQFEEQNRKQAVHKNATGQMR